MTIGFLLLSIFICFFAFLANKLKESEGIRIALAAFLSFALSGPITFTPDMHGYESWISNGGGRDFFFNFLLGNLDAKYQYYEFIHYIYIGITSIAFAFFISRFKCNPVLIILMFISLLYTHYATQIRFFAAYSLFSVSMYFWLVERKKYLGIVFYALALINHISILFMAPVLIYFKMGNRQVVKKTIVFTTAFSITLLMLFNFQFIPWEDLRFSEYLQIFGDGGKSSFFGGVFYLLPLIIIFMAVYWGEKWFIKKQPSLIQDIKFNLLFNLSFYPVVFIPLSFFVQILAQRFITTALLFQLIFVFYAANKMARKSKRIARLVGILLYIFIFTYQYFASEIILDNSYLSDTALEIFQSNVWIY